MRRLKFQTESQVFKPYNLMEIKVFQPLDAQLANLVDEDAIFRKLQLDYNLLQNFAFPVPDPNTARLTKEMLKEVDFNMLCRQMMVQIVASFMTKLLMEIEVSSEFFDTSKVEPLLDDFREGFDRRVVLMVVNHLFRKS